MSKELREKQAKIDALFKNSSSAIVMLDPEYRVVDINQEFENVFGYQLPEIKGEYLDNVLDRGKTGSADREKTRLVIEGNKVEGQGVRYSKGGVPKSFIFKGIPIVIEGEVVGAYGIYNNITELKAKEEQYRKIFTQAPVGIMLEDKRGKILEVNQKLCEITGYSKEELEGSSVFKTLVPGSSQKLAEKNIRKILAGNDLDFEADSRRQDGTKYLAHIKETSIMLPGRGKGILSMQMDITDIKEKEDRLKYLSFHDSLTDLYNRSFFEEELKRLNTERQLPLTLIMIDVNGLKLINDTYGHEFGDQILIKAADILTSVLRKEDIVVRLGGDEFAMILPQTAQSQAEKIVQRIKSKCMETENDKISVSLGVGYAVKKKLEQEIKEILNIADDRMYKDKLTNGRSEKNKLVRNLLETLGAKSNETREHAVRMTDSAFKLGEKIGLSNEQLNDLLLLATLHDIGKVTIAEEILKKPGKLNEVEWQIMREHSEKGYSIASATNEFAAVAKFILHHHERWDGSGYPEGLEGEKIPLLSRVIAIVDSFDVMTHDRPYSKAKSQAEALKELETCAGSQFDPDLVAEFIELF